MWYAPSPWWQFDRGRGHSCSYPANTSGELTAALLYARYCTGGAIKITDRNRRDFAEPWISIRTLSDFRIKTDTIRSTQSFCMPDKPRDVFHCTAESINTRAWFTCAKGHPVLAKTEAAEWSKRNDNILSFTSTTSLCTLQPRTNSHILTTMKSIIVIK